MDRYVKANAVLSLFSKQYMDLKKGLPVRPSEMGVLSIITSTEGQYTPVMLAEMLGISKPMITAHITALLNKGYVAKEPSSSDKRAYFLRPTESGKELAASAREDLNKHLRLMEKQMGKENFDTFVYFANTAYKIMKTENEEKENAE